MIKKKKIVIFYYFTLFLYNNLFKINKNKKNQYILNISLDIKCINIIYKNLKNNMLKKKKKVMDIFKLF